MTNAELKILQDAANSRTYKETAAALGTSEARVKNIACSVFQRVVGLHQIGRRGRRGAARLID